MFIQIAVGAIGVGVVVMVGYLVIAQVKNALTNGGISLDANTTNAINSTQTTIYAGFALVAVGIIVLAAFGLISVFK
jgi:hypothetical protein